MVTWLYSECEQTFHLKSYLNLLRDDRMTQLSTYLQFSQGEGGNSGGAVEVG